MAAVQSLIGPRHLKIFCDAFVEPEGNRRKHGMHIAVGCLVPEIFGNTILPGGEHRKAGVGLDEEGPAGGESGELPGHKGLVAGRILKQVEVDRLVGDRQIEPLADVCAERLQFPHESVLARERKIGMDHQLPGDKLGLAGKPCLLAPGLNGHATQGRQPGGP